MWQFPLPMAIGRGLGMKESKLKELGLKVMRFQDEEVLKDISTVLRNIELYIDDFEKHTSSMQK